jgi:predicted lipoprotein
MMIMKANFIKLSLFAAGLALLGCNSAKVAKEGGDAAARRALLAHAANDVIGKTYKEFAGQMEALEGACARLAEDASEAQRAGAQKAFRTAILTWERAEMYQVGPAARISSQTPGGKGLRQDIYAWPSRSDCGIAAALLDQSYMDEAAFEKAQYADARALNTLEVLLFDAGDDAHCDRPKVVDPAAFAALATAGELPARRAAYALTVARIVRKKADALLLAWADFALELGQAGAGSKLFPTTQDGLNALTDALFYLDTESKDMKLAAPAAISAECGDGCPQLAELYYAELSREALLANLRAFQQIFFATAEAPVGDELASIADLLRSVSAGKVADDLAALTDKAIAAVEAISPSLEVAAKERSAALETAYQSVQDLCTRLKTDFLAALSLSLPMNAAADND